MNDFKQVNVRSETHEAIRALAFETNLSMAEVVSLAIDGQTSRKILDKKVLRDKFEAEFSGEGTA